MYFQSLKALAIAFIVTLITSCSSNNSNPKLAIVEDVTGNQGAMRGIHVVDIGESLYSIAFRYGLDFRNLAAINGVNYPYKIMPGQSIILNKSNKLSPKNSKYKLYLAKKQRNKIRKQKTTPVKTHKNHSLKYKAAFWPVKGKIVSRYNGRNKFNKGIDIAVNSKLAVKSIENGVIVYRGTGLKGYGKLIIIKHSEEYLSAYAHNDSFVVKEGQKVKRGQQISFVGDKMKKLHFEIRKNGKPVNPLLYLSN